MTTITPITQNELSAYLNVLERQGGAGSTETIAQIKLIMGNPEKLQEALDKGWDYLFSTYGIPAPQPNFMEVYRAIKALDLLSSQDALFDMHAVMALLTKLAQEQRTSAREVRHSEAEAQMSTLLNAAQQIREAAKERFNAAIASGVFQILGGITQIACAGVAAKALTNSGLDAATEKAQTWNTAGSGGSGIFGGIGSIVSANYERNAAGHDAKKAELEAKAKAHDAAVDQAREQMQQMQDILRDIRDKLNAIEQSRAETTRGIARNI